MSKIKNSSMFLLWVGAAISITEIYTGGLVAPLGFAKGLGAIILGHLIGGILLALGGYISFTDKKNAMGKVRDALGEYGVKFVALLNVLQLIGWSAVMMIQGARGINTSLNISYNISLIIMAVLVFFWSYYFENKSKKINDIAVVLLLLLIGMVLFKVNIGHVVETTSSINFITAVELSIAMTVSWLPLIGDYSMKGESKKGVVLSSFLGYFISSSLMFTMGMLITISTGVDIIEFISSSTISIIACLIIVFSTVTTTFLDIYSAVESSKHIFEVKNSNKLIALYCLIGFVFSIFFPVENYENFLLTIGSVFVPVYTVVFVEYFINKDKTYEKANVPGIIVAFVGFVISSILIKYNAFMPTLFTIFIIFILYFATVKFLYRKVSSEGKI